MALQLRGDIEDRRREVADRLLRCMSLRQIARDIGTSLATVQRDVVAVRAEWRAQRLAAMDQRGAEDLARVNEVMKAIWPRVVAGEPAMIDRFLALLRYRADVLGLNATTKVDIEVHIREMAEREGLDPEEAVRDAVRIMRGVTV